MQKITRLIAGLIGTISLINGSLMSQDVPPNLKSIGGRWYVQSPEATATDALPTYFYEDAGRYVDLFSYHVKDSNKDGIPNVRVSHDSTSLIVDSQGYPNHPTALFPNTGNPNAIRVQDFHFRLPLQPRLATEITRVPMGPIALALNGVVFFNPFEMGGMNAVAGYSEVWLDSCCGHPQQTGVYHYHKYPTCVKSPFADDGKQHSPIIGFAFDGFPIYGPYESSGAKAKDLEGDSSLDVCNGHTDSQRGYHYHVTPGRFPYVLGGYAGVPDSSNSRGLRRREYGAIEDNTTGESLLPRVIRTLKPGTASRGGRRKVQIELDESASRRGIPPGKPSWVQIGPYEALEISRRDSTVEVEIEIGEDAAVGVLLDCHIEFDTAGPRIVFKKNDAFRIIE